MEKYIHFCLYERQRIERYLRKQKSRQFIADKLERSKSAIHNEIVHNSTRGVYDAVKASHKAYVKRKNSKIQCLKVAMDSSLREFVETQIKDDQSPAAISGRIKQIESQRKEKPIQVASTKSIYKFVYSIYGRQIESHLYQNAVKKRGGPKRGQSVFIDGRTSIEQRPQKVDLRRQFGHWEGDFIESGKDGKGSLLVLVERKTRYPFIRYIEKRDTASVNAVVSELLTGLPIESLTLDNDLSFKKHVELSELLQATIYFCHPFASHEKGTVENRNKAIRRYAKKRSDLSQYPLSHFAMIEEKLRTRFMECLGFKTPKEMLETEMKRYEKKQQKRLSINSILWSKNEEIITKSLS